MDKKPKKLLDQVRDALRLKHYAYRTGLSYDDWIRWNLLFYDKTLPKIWAKPKSRSKPRN